MGLGEAFISTWSTDKAKGYIIIALFLMNITGWGTAGIQRGEKAKIEELHQGALKAAQIYADEAGRLYEQTQNKVPFVYRPSDPVKRLLLSPEKVPRGTTD